MQHKEIDVSDYKSLLKIPRINSKAIEPDDYFISMESVENFREVKNYIGFHGMTIKPGRIYRSGMIGEIAEADIKKLKGLGIKSICDLRARNEVANSPDRAIEGIKYENIQVDAEKGIINVDELKNFFRNDNLLSGFQRKYLENLITGAKGYGTFLKKFTADENMAVLCHCTHGKDRTGIAICLLLMLLKVDEETILAEYSLSNMCSEALYKKLVETAASNGDLGISKQNQRFIMAAIPDVLGAVIEYVNSQGGIEPFLVDYCAMSEDDMAVIRRNLLE